MASLTARQLTSVVNATNINVASQSDTIDSSSGFTEPKFRLTNRQASTSTKLIENNGELALENDHLKKDLALSEERQKRYFDFWRSAEEELTRQLELNEKLKAELEAEKSKARSAEQGEKLP
ncbi:hypothetical protein FDENT_987 [Fusarium denticulatum]|uniref:Uncharacterized protein n=1 Tax=Fusarium denticulatum TaxID=48507 RepID=A0A8H6CWK5_9HYPO|nr:hypothetical protein FDENT_987 [Fusarium denticulatum]